MLIFSVLEDGSLDQDFAPPYGFFRHDGDPGFPNSKDHGHDITIDRKGRLLVAGYSSTTSGLRAAVWRIVVNWPPLAAPTGGGTYEIGSEVSLGGTVSDFEGEDLAYEWRLGEDVLFSGVVSTNPGGGLVPLPSQNLATAELGLGVHTIDLAVDDGINDEVVATIAVEVIDTISPAITLAPSTRILWPPNHKMVAVLVQADVKDNSGDSVDLSVEVLSSEPEESDSDGNSVPDSEIISVDETTGLIQLNLRAERQGRGDGRTYAVIVTATDSSGNSSTAQVEVFAPHDRGRQ